MPKYLERRNSRYYVRLVAPSAIQPYLSPAERVFRKSTGTGDLQRAKVIAAELVARKKREWLEWSQTAQHEQSALPTTLTPQLIEQIAGARLRSWVATDDRERRDGLDDAHLDKIEEFCRKSDGVMRSILAQNAGSRHWPDVVEEVLDWCLTLGYAISPSDGNFTDLMRAFAQAERQAQGFIGARNNGDNPRVEEVLPPTSARLSEMLAQYEQHRGKAVHWKTVSKYLSVWKRLITFKGDVFLDEVTAADIYAFFEDRLKPGPECWSEGYVKGHARRAITEIFKLGQTRGLMQGEGPMAKLFSLPELSKAERERRKKPRYAYSEAQINAILSSAWYQPGSTQFRGKMGQDLAARYFGPLIGLLHGLRVTESMQLLAGDVFESDDVLCLRFHVELEDEDSENESALPPRSVKNESVLRTIPVHPKLLALGFHEYVKKRQAGAGTAAPLFPSALPEANSTRPKWGRAYEQSFLRHVRDKLAFGSGFGSHSFRHQFEDRIRDCQARQGAWPAGLSQFLAGRKLPREADRGLVREEGSERKYGNGYRPSAVLPFQQRLNFSGIAFPQPFATWLGEAAAEERDRTLASVG